MRIILKTIAALLTFGTSAFAADLSLPAYKAPPMAPTFTWTGLYVGVNGGYGWGQTDHTLSVSVTGLPALTSGNFDVSGGVVGGTLGYNYQMGQWVLGLETDLDWAKINGTSSSSLTLLGVTAPFSVSSQLNWLDTTLVRVGWAYDRVLFYGTAGGAMGGLTTSANASARLTGATLGTSAFGVAATAGDTQTRFGWTAGAGIEWAFMNNMSAKVEYLYMDLGSQNQMLIDSVKFNTSIVRGGLNLKF